ARLPAVAISFVALVLAGNFLPGPSYVPELWIMTRPWVFEFLLGMAIAQWAARLQFHAAIYVGLVVGGFAALLAGPVGDIVPAALVVWGIVGLEPKLVEIRSGVLL